MKKILIWSLILVLAAVVSVIGTIAYFTAVDEEVNVMVVDDARIEIVEYERVNTNDKNTNAVVKKFRENKPLIPSVLANGATYAAPDASYNANFSVDNEGNAIKANYSYPVWNPDKIAHEIDKMVFVKNTGDCSVYVRLCFAFEAGNYVRIDRFKEMVHMNLNGDKNQWVWSWNNKLAEVDGTRCFIAWATYQKPVAPGELTDISLAQIALDHTAINDHARAFGDTYDVKVFAQGIQSDGFTTASAALSNGFDDTIPFKTVKFLEFTDLKAAITKAGDLNTVTFGLTSEHPDVVKSYNGILVANIAGQADFTAYAYHVPAGNGLYDVYVLADNWKIYTPNDSGALFKDRANLTKVDTSNLNVSETTKMNEMFYNCIALSDLDVSEWDVGNVTTFSKFLRCEIDSDGDGLGDTYNEKLTSLDVGNWNTENVTDMSHMFFGCSALASLDVSSWNVSNVKNMSCLFAYCRDLENLHVSDWMVDNVSNMSYIFYECNSVKQVNVSDWNVINVTNMQSAFYNCWELSELCVTGWNVSNVTNMKFMFYGCNGVTSLNLSGWNVSSATTMMAMFNSCANLETLTIGTWNVSGVTDFSNMFEKCYALKNIDIENWDVKKAKKMTAMFRTCNALTELDLSGWKTENLINTKIMFENSSNLTTIYVGDGWDMADVTASADMFNGCTSLVGGTGTVYNSANVDQNYANYTTGYLTKKSA